MCALKNDPKTFLKIIKMIYRQALNFDEEFRLKFRRIAIKIDELETKRHLRNFLENFFSFTSPRNFSPTLTDWRNFHDML